MGLFSRRRPETSAAPPHPELVDHASTLLVPGFVDRIDAVEMVRDHFDREDGDPDVENAVTQAWQRRRSEQRNWRGPSDYDRMVAAFADLTGQGVLARMNFTCCQNCGTSEIDDERTPLVGAAPGQYAWREWAYAFFHQQDAARLAEEPTVLHLSYSAFRAAPHLDPVLVRAARDGDADAARRVRIETDGAVGTMVAAALREQGLTVDWDGNPDARLAVSITDWRKPLPG